MITLSKPEFACDIFVSIFEDQNGRLVDLDGPGFAIFGRAVIKFGLFACRDASVDLRYEISVEQLEKDHSSAWIHHLLHGCPVFLVPDSVPNKNNQVRIH